MGEIVLGKEIVIDSPVDTVGEVEVVDTPRKTRTRRRASKKIIDCKYENLKLRNSVCNILITIFLL